MTTKFRLSLVTIANRISKYWRSQKSEFENCFKVYKDPQVNTFFWCSCLLGGILKTKKVSQTLKKIWLICNITSLFIFLALNLACLVWYEKTNRTTLKAFSQPILTIASLGAGHAIVYRYMDLIEKYADGLAERIEFEQIPLHEQASFNGRMSQLEIFISISPCSLLIVEFLSRYVLDFEIPEEFCSFFYPFNENFRKYHTITLAIISFVQFLTMLQLSIALLCVCKKMKLIIAIMKRTCTFYLNQIENIGSSTLQQMERNHNEELLMEQNEPLEMDRLSGEFIRQRNVVEDNFEKEMAYSSKQIWSLIRILLTMQPLFENACTSQLFTLYAMAIPIAGQLLWFIHNPTQVSVLLMNATFLFLTVYLFYKLCYLSAQHTDMMDKFPIEVYSTPWHMMSKKTRRTIHIILTQTQYEYRSRIFKTIPIDMGLFYRFLHSLYSNSSFIHGILERQK